MHVHIQSMLWTFNTRPNPRSSVFHLSYHSELQWGLTIGGYETDNFIHIHLLSLHSPLPLKLCLIE